ncbi:tyrosine-type recombinase/integrase, partial [Herbiconiux daphne]
LSTVAVTLLKELCDGRDKDSRLINLSSYGLTQAFRRSARLTGVYGVCFHSLRHTCITRYAEKGLSTLQLQQISGHRSIVMLERYTHLKAESIVGLMD